ncbi:hypothetical protein Ssi03_25590 [Sphaerisporangium siamense]|uniref:HTH merR-type domain-containing protein n=1 Tax=Sphaerisporangium siamense TaxID=795645 RepID=A0A7W7D6Z7_9ACTN|nr:MerR family transcriptional regulator [Sphaerisporangium siamense]MBB4700116.1 hypothetical protein [Sphaerisporangium siamense]GII84569.1 hypothetical protein Ssi03_25590 [Sphaerisporangium siamense]
MGRPPPVNRDTGTSEIAKRIGVPRHKLAYWIEAGYLHPGSGGHGVPQDWSAAEVAIAVLLARLVAAGMGAAPAAAVARSAVAFELREVELGPGLPLRIGAVDG